VTGQYLGIIILILISLLGLLLGAIIENHWISLLGILPLAIGVKELVGMWCNHDDDEESVATQTRTRFQFLNVALVTIANGGDNIGVYGPLFANISLREFYIYLIVFLILTAVLCLMGYYFVKHPKVKMIFSKNGKIILPFFLIFLGLFIMKDFLLWLF
jgi:cadmium resistance protein CadD (predicted permease)